MLATKVFPVSWTNESQIKNGGSYKPAETRDVWAYFGPASVSNRFLASSYLGTLRHDQALPVKAVFMGAHNPCAADDTRPKARRASPKCLLSNCFRVPEVQISMQPGIDAPPRHRKNSRFARTVILTTNDIYAHSSCLDSNATIEAEFRSGSQQYSRCIIAISGRLEVYLPPCGCCATAGLPVNDGSSIVIGLQQHFEPKLRVPWAWTNFIYIRTLYPGMRRRPTSNAMASESERNCMR
jgi:hypothetical protein